jgi:hypothetical protein
MDMFDSPSKKEMSKTSSVYGMQLAANTLHKKEILGVAHANTVFHQVLSLIPRYEFEALARKHITGRRSRVFSRWNQFACLLFIHLAGRRSMRDGIRSLRANIGRLYHLGLCSVARSTFADANTKRPADFFQALVGKMYQRCATVAPGHKFRFKAKLFSFDSSVVKLCLSAFPWADFRARRGGMKLHVVLDHDGYLPTFARVTKARLHVSKMAKMLKLPKGSIAVFDKVYINYSWFRTLGASGLFFVTRLKTNAVYKVVRRNSVRKGKGVTSNHLISVNIRGKELRLRRIGYRDPETGKFYEFLTNHFNLSPKTIADIYKGRWQIETFFRLIKQNLRLKSFVGTSENAVLSQVYVAMIAYLIVAWLKFRSGISFSLQQMFQLLQVNLFDRRELEGVFKKPDEHRDDINNDYRLLNYVA